MKFLCILETFRLVLNLDNRNQTTQYYFNIIQFNFGTG